MSDHTAARVAERYRRTAQDEDAQVEKLEKRLRSELGKITQGAGKLVEVRAYPSSKGGGWAATFDKEYAALKTYYKYRNSKVNLTKGPKGWVVTVK